MSKLSRKINRAAKKETRKILGDGINVMHTMIRQRPNWIPKFIWIVLYLPLFKVKTLKIIYHNI